MAKITYSLPRYGGVILHHPDGRTIYCQNDWDYPSIANYAIKSWYPCRKCLGTDGTVKCEHRAAPDMINDAIEALQEHEGEAFEDPGYFDGEES